MAMRNTTMALVIFVSVVVITVHTAEANLNIHHTMSKLHARDVLPSQDPMKTGEFESLIQCASVCQMNEECKSFAYNQPYCHLMEDVYDVSGSDHKDAPGFKYYYVERNLKSAASNITKTTTPPATTTVPPTTSTEGKLQVEAVVLNALGGISWEKAEENCKEKGGNLVSILNEDDHNQVIEAMKAKKIENAAWIGLKSIDADFNFQWLAGPKLENVKKGTKSDNPFQRWHKDNPDNPGKDYPVRIIGTAIIHSGNFYTFKDETPNHNEEAYICEYRP